MKKNLAHLLFIPLLLSVVSCSDDPAVVPDEPVPPTPQQPVKETIVDLTPAEITALKENVIYFGDDVALMHQAQVTNNFSTAVSGLCSGLLGQIAGCSQFDIAREIAGKSLKPFEKQKDLESAYFKFIDKIDKADPDVKLYFKSALWFSKIEGNSVKNDFEDKAEAKFATLIRPVNENGTNEIARLADKWAMNQTDNRYADFMPPTSEFSPKALLATLLYFKGAWADPFESESDGEFVGISKSTQVKMLNKKARMSYMHNKQGQWVKMELGSEGYFELQLCLPDNTPEQAHGYSDWKNKYVNLSFPCFMFNPSKNAVLTDTFYKYLRTLSGEIKWDEEKDKFVSGKFDVFCPIYTSPVDTKLDFFSGICVDFSNKVVEGAKPNPIPTDTPEPIIMQMNFNHPFFFRIVEKTTGLTLVDGMVNDID